MSQGHTGGALRRIVAFALNRREGYDHSYYFISSFMADHLRWHAERLS